MRLIEQQMNKAISTETDWKKDNTSVINIEGVSFVYLYNNLIAMVGDTWLELFDGGYKSATTKSRLNAILKEHGNSEYVYQKNFEWFVSTKYGDVEFNDGIKLNWVTEMRIFFTVLVVLLVANLGIELLDSSLVNVVEERKETIERLRKNLWFGFFFYAFVYEKYNKWLKKPFLN